jgi:preprotein translocase subunit SecF
MKCKTCGGEMIQKSRLRLITVGLVQMASIAIAIRFSWFWAPGIILFLTGAYLIVWGTFGRGGWCRTCKKFGLY